MSGIDKWIIDMRWAIANKEFSNLKELKMDCYYYIFNPVLNKIQMNSLLDFMKDNETTQQLSVLDFCNFFLNNKINFTLKFRYCNKRNIKHNLLCFKVIKNINKELVKLQHSCS